MEPTAAKLPHAVAAGEWDRQTDRQKDTVPLHRPRRILNKLQQWFPSIPDNGPKAISREVCGATSENKAKLYPTLLLWVAVQQQQRPFNGL